MLIAPDFFSLSLTFFSFSPPSLSQSFSQSLWNNTLFHDTTATIVVYVVLTPDAKYNKIGNIPPNLFNVFVSGLYSHTRSFLKIFFMLFTCVLYRVWFYLLKTCIAIKIKHCCLLNIYTETFKITNSQEGQPCPARYHWQFLRIVCAAKKVSLL